MTDTATPAPPALKTFADFAVDERICTALVDAGITHPFPIQELTLPLALAGADLIGQARTGTGKTLAFGIPLIQNAAGGARPGATTALVIVPTRELCLQVRDDLARAAARTDVRVVAVYGGKSIDAQVEALRDGGDIVVGTPGRLLDLLRRGSLTLSGVTRLVLDEADEMLDLGFLPDVEQLIQATADDRQTLLFSATMPSQVVGLARRYMNKPTFMRADVEEVRIAPETTQYFFSCHRMDKSAVVARILQTPGRGLCLVFSRTKRMADVLVEELRAQGVAAAAIHSDLRQEARERALSSFRKGKTDVLVATEVAARGLDITDVTHVVNYDCPDDEKMYLHRIGRTGRAGAAGVAVTLAVWNELARLEMIKKALGVSEPTHEVFSTSPLLEELFDLPPVATARRGVDGSSGDRSGQAPDGRRRPSADTGPKGSSRSRRRRSGRRGGAAGDTDGAAPVAAETTGADRADMTARAGQAPDAGRGGDVIRRTRTRRRAGSGDAPEPAAASPEPAAASPKPADAAPEPARAIAEPADAVPQRARADTAKDSAPPLAAANRTSRSSRSGRGRTVARGRDGRRPPQPTPPRGLEVDSDAARGTGKPRLTRPLVISYLP